MASSYWVSRLAGFALLAANAAHAVPTHYIVFTMDRFAHVQPVFYTEVDLARPEPAAAAQTAREDETSFSYHAWRDGIDLGAHTLNVPDLRAEFARDPARGDGTIESHPVKQAERSFVLRIPVNEADTIEFLHNGLSEHFELAALAANARSMALANQLPSLQIHREVTSGNPANRVDILVMGDGTKASSRTNSPPMR